MLDCLLGDNDLVLVKGSRATRMERVVESLRRLASTDVVHGLYVDGYDLSVTADPGQPATLSFLANKSGSFRLRCSVTCGALHPFMLGKLQVGTNLLFWRGLGLAFVALLGVFFVRKPLLVAETIS